MASLTGHEIREWARYRREGDLDYRRDDDDVERLLRWIAAASELSSRVASVLGRTSVPVSWVPDDAIAYTDGEEVFLSLPWFLDNVGAAVVSGDSAKTARSWALFKAIVFHELSHIIWTPRVSQKPMPQLKDLHETFVKSVRASHVLSEHTSIHEAMNILEDQRIETLFTTRYSPAKKSFTLMVRDVVYGASWVSGLLLHGRRYLPNDLRAKAWVLFEAKWESIPHYLLKEAEVDHVSSDDIKDAISRYCLLTFPKDADEAVEIIHLIAKVMNVARVDDTSQGESPKRADLDRHDTMKSGKPVSPATQREDVAKVEETYPDEEGSVSEASGSDTADADQAGDTSGSVGDSGVRDAASELAEALDELIETDEFSEMLDRELKAIRTAAGEAKAVKLTPEKSVEPHGTVNGYYGDWPKVARKALSAKLAEVFFEVEEGWARHNSSGRLNVVDVMAARGQHFEVFDRWVDNTEEATSFEVVILLDESGSMGGSLQHCSAQACWTIERALSDLDIPTTVIGYGSHTRMLKNKEESFSNTVVPLWKASGGTVIDPALNWAASVFERSAEQNKILLTITDGAFYADEELMGKIHNYADSILVGLGKGCTAYGEPHHQRVVEFPSPVQDLRRLPDILGNKIVEVCRNQQAMSLA
jgi:hypothetical protein